MNNSSPPPPPDPAVTAAAAAKANKETAITQYGLNATNQVTPYGNLSYKQIGQWPDGTPRYEATTSLSPEEQTLYDKYTATQSKFGDIAGEQTSRVAGLLSSPVNLNNEATEARLTELGRKRIDPRMQEGRAALEANLLNRGIRPGSEAYDSMTRQFGERENDAYNQLYLTGRGQAVQEALTERNQPLNELSALMSGSQVQQPNFQNTPTPGVAPVNVGDITNQAYQGQMAGWAEQQTSKNAMMSGIFGMAAAPLGGWAYGGFKGL